jgi:hypothetical protein
MKTAKSELSTFSDILAKVKIIFNFYLFIYLFIFLQSLGAALLVVL